MVTIRDLISVLVALLMIFLSTSLAAGIFSGLAAWVLMDSWNLRHYRPTANRRYLMRQTRRRTKA